MPRGRYNVLHRQTRKIVYEVLKFMKKESEEGLQYDLKCVQKRTATATGVSERTVRRISSAANDSSLNLLSVFQTPGKKRTGKKKITGLDSFNLGYIKRCIHNFHLTEKELPTINLLLKKMKRDINFQGSASSLRRIIKDLGFKYKIAENNKKVLVEQTSIRLKRIQYLQMLSKYRSEGRPIVYTDETCLNSSHTTSKGCNDDSTEGVKPYFSKGQRLTIVHAGYNAAFVPDGLLMFKASMQSINYRNNINYTQYENWVRSRLIPNLPPHSVVVMDNTSCHNKLENAAPTCYAKKSEMFSWLTQRGIPCNSTMHKPELYKLICLPKEDHKMYTIDKIIQQHNHTVLRLPPYHPDLNPMEMAWESIKSYVADKNVTGNINDVMRLVEEKVNMMGENEWNALCDKVMLIEEEYKKSDKIIDALTDEYIIHGSENESDTEKEVISNFSESEDDDDDSSIEEGPCTSINFVSVDDVVP